MAYTDDNGWTEPCASAEARPVGGTGGHSRQYGRNRSTMSPERGSPNTGVEVDALEGAVGRVSRTAANVETLDIIARNWSGDETHNESENVEDRAAQHDASYRGASALGSIGRPQTMCRPTGGDEGEPLEMCDFRTHLCLFRESTDEHEANGGWRITLDQS